jgi:hypothetical protein
VEVTDPNEISLEPAALVKFPEKDYYADVVDVNPFEPENYYVPPPKPAPVVVVPEVVEETPQVTDEMGELEAEHENYVGYLQYRYELGEFSKEEFESLVAEAGRDFSDQAALIVIK